MQRQRLILLTEYIRKLIRRNATPNLSKVVSKSHPSDIAHVIPNLTNTEIKALFAVVTDPSQRADILCELEPNYAVDIFNLLTIEEASQVLSEMNDDDAASILDSMDEDMAIEILDQMEDRDSLEVERLLQYDEETAGRIMTTDFLALNQEVTVQEAMEAVRKAAETDMIFYVYVTDEHDHLLGVVSLRQLLVARLETPLRKIMNPEVIAVLDTLDQEEVAHVVAQYDFLAVPVITASSKIVGIVTVDDIVDVIKDEATEDILKLAGVSEEEMLSPKIGESARKRMFWLIISMGGGLASANIINHLGGDMSTFKQIVPFIPVIMGMGGNVGTQTISLVVRGLATGVFSVSNYFQILVREVSIATILGTCFGIIVGAYGGLTESIALGVTVGISMLMAMLVSTSVAVTMPIVFERFRIDPAIASGPFVTTSIDILGLLIYFSAAAMLL